MSSSAAVNRYYRPSSLEAEHTGVEKKMAVWAGAFGAVDGVVVGVIQGLLPVHKGRHRMLKIDYRSLFGYFPVCLINPDIGAVMSISGKRESSRTGIQTDRAAE